MTCFTYREVCDLLALNSSVDPHEPIFRVEVAQGSLVVDLSDYGSAICAGPPSGWRKDDGCWTQEYDPGCTHGVDCDRPECYVHIHEVWWEKDLMVGCCDTAGDDVLCDHFEWPDVDGNDLVGLLPVGADISPHPDYGRQPVTVTVTPAPVTLTVTRHCPCGEHLGGNPRQTYCSTACRVAAHRGKFKGGGPDA